MAPQWVNAVPHICYLTQQYRQTNDELNEILMKFDQVVFQNSDTLNYKNLQGKKSKAKLTRLNCLLIITTWTT